MPGPQERMRNNVRAGIFMSLSILLAVAVLVSLTDVWAHLTHPMSTYSVRYTVESGVNGLQPGSVVRVGGIDKGAVTRVEPEVMDGEALRTILVEFELDRDIVLYDEARVVVSSPLIGTGAWLDIVDVGSSTTGHELTSTLQGVSAAGFLTALLGPGGAESANDIVANAEKFSAFLDEVPAAWQKRVEPTLDNVHGASEDIRSLTSRMQSEDWPRWADRVDELGEWASKATVDADATLEESRQLIRDYRAIATDNREKVNRIVDNMEITTDEAILTIDEFKMAGTNAVDITERVKSETVDLMNDLLLRGQSGVDEAITVIQRVGVETEGYTADIDEILGNATLASQQLKLALIEIRRSPWKVLYRPTTAEVEHELLYEAARSFALAAADLKASSASVQRVLDRYGTQLDGGDGTLARMRDSLVDSLDHYEKAQQRLFDVLLDDHP